MWLVANSQASHYFHVKSTVIMQVNHPQWMNDKPQIPGFIAKCVGMILASHCDCMAGLGLGRHVLSCFGPLLLEWINETF